MARLPRVSISGVPQHVVQRGNNKQDCFFNAKDRGFYINKLHEACLTHDVKVHAFVLMTNHVHLLMTPYRNNGVSRVMQTLGRNYVRYVNTEYRRSGTLWEGRFKSSLVQTGEYLFAVYKYIELNPVRAGIVEHPKDYFWSSYHHNIGKREISVINAHPEYLALGDSPTQRAQCYQHLIESGLHTKTTKDISTCLNQAKIYGDSKFKEEISLNLKRKVQPLKHGGDRRSIIFKKTSC